MIILAPTGFYKKSLPKTPTDNTPVTYTISNNAPPPLANVRIIQLPISQEKRKLPVMTQRRALYGDRLFTVSSGRRSVAGSNRKLYEVGEYIEFTSDRAATVDPISVPDEVYIQHNTNVPDLSVSGLSDAELSSLLEAAELKRKELRNQLASLQVQVDNLRTQIVENQKEINETLKVRKSAAVAFGIVDGLSNTGNTIYDKINTAYRQKIDNNNALVAQVNEINRQMASVRDDLVNVSEVVR